MRNQTPVNTERLSIKDIKKFEQVSTSSQANFVNLQNNCVLCTTDLEITVSFIENENAIIEEAHCPSCKLKLRSKKHVVC